MALFVLLGLLALSSASYANKIQPYCYALQEEPTKLPPPVFMCSKCRAKAWMYWTWDPTTFIPLCNPKDDSWAAKQCSKGKCWCVDKYGKKIKASTRPKAKPLNCKKIRADTKKKTKKSMSECLKKAAKPSKNFKPQCDAKGNFKPIQCVSGPGKNQFCWCSLPNGIAIPATVHRKNSKRKPKCLRHINLKYKCGKFQGNRKHPFSRKRFISCTPGKVYACACPGRTVYNRFKGVCAYTTKKG